MSCINTGLVKIPEVWFSFSCEIVLNIFPFLYMQVKYGS